MINPNTLYFKYTILFFLTFAPFQQMLWAQSATKARKIGEQLFHTIKEADSTGLTNLIPSTHDIIEYAEREHQTAYLEELIWEFGLNDEEVFQHSVVQTRNDALGLNIAWDSTKLDTVSVFSYLSDHGLWYYEVDLYISDAEGDQAVIKIPKLIELTGGWFLFSRPLVRLRKLID